MNIKIEILNDDDFEVLKSNSDFGFAKPIPIKLEFEIAQNDCIIETLEGTHNVPSGSYIMTGLEGEKYAMSEESFNSKYESIIYYDESKKCGQAKKKVNPNLQYTYLHPKVKFSAKMWNGLFDSQEGDYLIRYGKDDFGLIKPHLFTKLYNDVISK